MAENNRLTYIVAIAGILLFVVMSVAFLHFWIQPNSATSIDAYTISVKGLDDHRGLIGDVIIVPLPVRNGKEVFSDKDLQYQKFGNWTSVLVMTKDGKMLGFQTNTGDLSDLQARFYKSSGEADFSTLEDTTLLPVINDSVALYTSRVSNSGNVKNYTTKVYIPDTIRPDSPEAKSITFDMEFLSTEGISPGKTGRNYHIDIHEAIPVNISGPVSVNAQTWISE
ncbi:hypothetical protein [Methanoregula sp. UBA64]|jgi:hypothetical protein|uniref:hypothetical protein n=1 Tax=Methanoregula sp. UBA64 TaxID=1915554 RepID=UPI0025F63AFF|nr:hypothetical protein [Methanoregula sp. UBA64]